MCVLVHNVYMCESVLCKYAYTVRSLTVCVKYYSPTVWRTCSPRAQGTNHCLLLFLISRETGFVFNFECPSNARALSDCYDNHNVFRSGPPATLSCGLNGK